LIRKYIAQIRKNTDRNHPAIPEYGTISFNAVLLRDEAAHNSKDPTASLLCLDIFFILIPPMAL